MPRPVLIEIPRKGRTPIEYRIPGGAAVARRVHPDARIVAYDDGGLAPREPYEEPSDAPEKPTKPAEKAG